MPTKNSTNISCWAIINNDAGKFLLLKRSKKANNPNTYCLPGGRHDKGEDPAKSVRRECMEEIGFDPGPMVLQQISAVNSNASRTFWYFKAKRAIEEKKIKLNEESSEFVWVNTQQANKLPLHKSTKMFLEDKKPLLRFRTNLVQSSLFINVSAFDSENQIIGTATVCAATGKLFNVRVNDGFRGKNFMTAIVSHAVHEYRPSNLFAKASPDSSLTTNQLADFYSRFGFQKQGQPGYHGIEMTRKQIDE